MGGSEQSVRRLRSSICALRCSVLVCVAVVACAAGAVSCGASSSAGKGATGPEAKGDDSGDTAGDTGTGGSTSDPVDRGGDLFGDTGSSSDAASTGPEVADMGGPGDTSGSGGDDSGKSPPEAAKPAADPAVDRFKTKTPPKKLSGFLEKPAEQAMKKQEWAKAVALLQALVVARGDACPEALELATAWTVLGQYDDAIGVYNRYISASNDPVAIRKARTERDRLIRAKEADPFAREFRPHRASKEAAHAFKEGRNELKKNNYADALLYFRMGSTLDPDLPGFLRELGYTYDKLGAKKEKIEFFQKYLLARPFGKNADEVRKEMAKEKGALGKLTIDTPLPCDEVWVNRQLVGSSKKLPIKKMLAAPGDYMGLCVSSQYAIAVWEPARVDEGKSSALFFHWAVVVNELTNPYGRIKIEYYQTGQLYPLRIGQSEVGVAVPPDGRALRVEVVSLDGQKREERYMKLQPGAREVIKW